MGRKSIKIEKIEDEKRRASTLEKRRTGLIKKASELSILCGVEIGLHIFSNNTLYRYTSSGPERFDKMYQSISRFNLEKDYTSESFQKELSFKTRKSSSDKASLHGSGSGSYDPDSTELMDFDDMKFKEKLNHYGVLEKYDSINTGDDTINSPSLYVIDSGGEPSSTSSASSVSFKMMKTMDINNNNYEPKHPQTTLNSSDQYIFPSSDRLMDQVFNALPSQTSNSLPKLNSFEKQNSYLDEQFESFSCSYNGTFPPQNYLVPPPHHIMKPNILNLNNNNNNIFDPSILITPDIDLTPTTDFP